MSRPDRVHDRIAAGMLLLATAAIMVVTLVWHRTPLYGVETDLLGDTIPAARDLLRGHITSDTFLFRGPGYPSFLAAAAWLARGDWFLAARWLNVTAFAAAGWFAYGLFRGVLGGRVALVVLAAFVTTPVVVRTAIEAGTDLPALALALISTRLATGRGGFRSVIGAGLIAAIAYMTRYNTIFLAPAAVLTLLARRAPSRHLLGYVAGFALPVGAWILVQTLVTGRPPRNQNFLNIAYEVYGRGMSWDQFWVQVGNPFASFFDVVRHDPVRFAMHIGRNFGTRWLTDARELMPVWIGALAIPGLALTWWRRPGARILALHAVLAYLVLTLVFYNPRFFLYLLPFYLSGTFGLLLRGHLDPRPAPGRLGGTGPDWLRLAGPTVAAILIVLSAASATLESRKMLADPPDETRAGGELLRGLGRPGERVLARKPHVAYFAGMEYVPIPHAEAFTEFMIAVRRSRADYLFISQVEASLHPQLSVLVDPGVTLPGLVPIARRMLRASHYYVLYRVGENDAPLAAIEDSLLLAIRRFAARRPGQVWPHLYLGGHLVTMGRFQEALVPLDEAQRLDPTLGMVARFQAVARAELGDHDQAAAAAQRAIDLAAEPSWERGLLGEIRLAQGRYAEAREELRRAMQGEPANPRYPRLFLKASALGGFWADVAVTAEQLLRTTPEDGSALLLGARAWLQLGRADRARALLETPGVPSGPDAAAVTALADSLRRSGVPRP